MYVKILTVKSWTSDESSFPGTNSESISFNIVILPRTNSKSALSLKSCSGRSDWSFVWSFGSAQTTGLVSSE